MSHASECTFYDTLEIAEKPMIASHSNSAVVCPHPRSLTDNQFRSLAASGGGAGVNLCPDFLHEGGADIDRRRAPHRALPRPGGERPCSSAQTSTA